MSLKILLLDVDGVLIHALGYRESVRAAIRYFTNRMQQPHIMPPTDADMRAFEARSIIFEWDSAALMVAAMLHQVPDLWRDTLDETLNAIADAGVHLAQPDYAALAQQVPQHDDPDTSPTRTAPGTVFPEHPVFIELLQDTHSVEAPVTQIIQHFVLGDEQYARTYRKTPLLETPSLLTLHDVPMLTPETLAWLQADSSILPVMYTARPSLPPGFVMDWAGYSPEAEYAQRLLGLVGVPLMGYGRMQWVAKEAGVPVNSFVKPSPYHALAGIYSAVLQSQGVEDWEKRALQMVHNNAPIPDTMRGQPWQVFVFEDSPSSIQGVKRAVERLSAHHTVTFMGIGIADDIIKTGSLLKVADHVSSDVNTGLRWALEASK